jgi:hypothetical protein
VLGAGISAGLMLLAFRGVDWRGARDTLVHANGWGLLAALLSVLLTTWARACRWRLMYYPQQRCIRRGKAFSLLLAGQVINAVVPLRLGEVARAYLMGRSQGVSKAQGLWTAVVEKALDTLVLLLVIAVLGVAVPLPIWLRSAGWTLSAATLVALVLLAVALIFQPQATAWLVRLEQRFGGLARLRTSHLVTVVGQSVRELASSAVSLELFLWSLLAFALASLTNWLTGWALGLPLSLQAALLLLAVLQISAVVPIPTSPGRIGVFHYLCVITLAIFGVGRDAALTYGLILHVLVYLPMMILGPIGLWLESVSWRDLRHLADSAGEGAHGPAG